MQTVVKSEPDSNQKNVRFKRKWPIAATVVVLFIIGAICGWWYLSRPVSLLPDDIKKQASGFVPYFYVGKVPVGYTLDRSNATQDNGVLILPLVKKGSPTIVITEQKMPDLSLDDLQKNGEKVKDTRIPAAINDVEGRRVGVMADQNRKTFILLNSPGDTPKETLIELMQKLQLVE